MTSKQEKLIQKYANLGIEVSTNYHDEPAIDQVRLKYTPEQWLGLLDADGEYLPRCCADISSVRDYLFSAVRESGWIRTSDLGNLVNLLKNHDCADMNLPLQKLVSLWETIKDDACVKLYVIPAKINDLQDAIITIARSSSVLFYDGREDSYENDVTKRKHFYRLLPAFRTVFDHLHKMKLSSVEGYGVFANLAKGIEIVDHLGGGYAIYPTEEQAKETVDYLQKFSKNSEILDYRMSKVRVSVEKGLEIIEDSLYIGCRDD